MRGTMWCRRQPTLACRLGLKRDSCGGWSCISRDSVTQVAKPHGAVASRSRAVGAGARVGARHKRAGQDGGRVVLVLVPDKGIRCLKGMKNMFVELQ